MSWPDLIRPSRFIWQRRASAITRFIVPAMRLHPSRCSSGTKVLPQTDGKLFSSSLEKQGRRSAERRTTVAAPRYAGHSRGHLRPLALRRSSAVMRRDYSSQLGLGRASWNHRVKGGPLADASAVSTSQSDHAPDGTMPKPPAGQERRTPARRNRSRSVSPRHRRRPSR